MMRSMLLLLVSFSLCFSQFSNTTGRADTSKFIGFKADSLKYSRLLKLSAYENVRIDMFANDTNTAGYGSDSVAFEWGVQNVHTCYNASGALDTVFSNRFTIDTFRISVANCVPATVEFDSLTGSPVKMQLRKIDTLNVTGLAYQTRNPSVEWDDMFRVWIKGLTGNRVGGFVRVTSMVTRRLASSVR